MSEQNEMRRPEELASDLSRRDAEWMKWEGEVVQVIVDQLQPLLLANYPGSGWFRIRFIGVNSSANNGGWSGVSSAFGGDMKRLFVAIDTAFNPAGWQMRGSYDGYSNIKFNFRPIGESDGIMGRFSSIEASASIDHQAPSLPDKPVHVRPALRGLDTAVSGVLLKQGAAGAGSNEPFIYEHFC